MLVRVLKFGLAEFTMKGLPSVSGNVGTDLLVLIPTEPLAKALDVDMRHRSGALARRYEWILLSLLVKEADPTDCVV